MFDELNDAVDFIKKRSQWNVNITLCLTWNEDEIERLTKKTIRPGPKNLVPWDELSVKGVKNGSIVVYPLMSGDETRGWHYALIGRDFPEEFNTSLECYKGANGYSDGKMHLSGLGFHWCGSMESFRMRPATPKERVDFIKTCVDTLKTPSLKPFWGIDEFSQVLCHLIREGLVNKDMGEKLNEELKRTYDGTDLLEHYKLVYGNDLENVFE